MFEKSALGSLVERQQGGGTPERNNPRFWNGSIPWASVKDFADDQLVLLSTEDSITQQGLTASSTNLIPAGTPLVCTRMAVGRCAISNSDVSINQDVKALFPKANVSPRYLLRVLDSLKFHAESVSVGSTVKGIRISDLLGIQAPIAPPHEQPRIAQILDTLDTQIQKTEALIAKLEKIKEGLLHDLLTRGIDQKGQLRPTPEQAPALYKESALALIPEHWRSLKLDDLAEFFNGNSFKAEGWAQSGYPIIRIQNLNGDQVFNYYRGPVRSQWHVMPNDLLFAWSGQRGVSFGARIWGGPEGVLNQHIFKVVPKEAISKYFLYLTLRHRQKAIENSAHGFKDSFLHVTRGELTQTLAAVPPHDEQRRIVDVITRLEKRLDSETKAKKTLASLKTGLMDDLLTGHVRVTPLLKDAV
ncbi:restriction endonuclease subunit S [Marinobacter shengliensis]|uniref:Restriction endonuclease subunit S n=1 Tax=Marinobacter shengliensis TaxID=1389223 RepID=A0ABV4WC71_9GAMM